LKAARTSLAIMLALGLAWGAAADTPDDTAIATLLMDHDVVYPDVGWERHEANGRLLARAVEGPWGRTSVGEWQVAGGQRCLRWHRGQDWACYRVEIGADDASAIPIRFVDDYGNVSAGLLVARGAGPAALHAATEGE
jgi:hypothetical protein